jgi:hypothetical protein
MKFAMQMDYNRVIVMDHVTFAKLTEVLSKSQVRYKNGYGNDALYTPDKDIPTILVLQQYQLVDSLPTVEEPTE